MGRLSVPQNRDSQWGKIGTLPHDSGTLSLLHFSIENKKLAWR
jgi:hypothetical protein